MTGKQLWEQYQHYTRDLTEHGRKLGFAGAAICWLFKNEAFTFPTLIYLSLLFFVAYFIADVMQSLLGALFVRFFTEAREAEMWKRTQSIQEEIHKPRWVDLPAFVCFIAKCILLVFGFVFIACELLKRLIY